MSKWETQINKQTGVTKHNDSKNEVEKKDEKTWGKKSYKRKKKKKNKIIELVKSWLVKFWVFFPFLLVFHEITFVYPVGL